MKQLASSLTLPPRSRQALTVKEGEKGQREVSLWAPSLPAQTTRLREILSVCPDTFPCFPRGRSSGARSSGARPTARLLGAWCLAGNSLRLNFAI